MNVWEGYQFIGVRANKEQSGRSYTVDQYNLGLKAVDVEFLKTKYGLPEEYKPGAPLPRQAWEVSQKITDDLRHLKVIMGGRDKAMMLVDADGYADVPVDYIHQSSIRYDKTVNAADCASENEESSVPVEELTDANFDSRVGSVIKKPWSKYPFCRFNNNYIEFRPRNIQFVKFSYIRMPIPAFLSVTLDENNDYVYDPANSRDWEWPSDMDTDVLNILFKWLSDNLSNPMMMQSAVMRQDKGQ